ncbi:hypothetical protein BaRGS_00039948 [Batillaria attramentaria]|uniref:Uncharacterized protein n=1 Tax=Batillaria attramentaria TaxID=370345 RepID=A0ABD0J1Z1_9CAEN
MGPENRALDPVVGGKRQTEIEKERGKKMMVVITRTSVRDSSPAAEHTTTTTQVSLNSKRRRTLRQTGHSVKVTCARRSDGRTSATDYTEGARDKLPKWGRS